MGSKTRIELLLDKHLIVCSCKAWYQEKVAFIGIYRLRLPPLLNAFLNTFLHSLTMSSLKLIDSLERGRA
jgi:hypothetical protein